MRKTKIYIIYIIGIFFLACAFYFTPSYWLSFVKVKSNFTATYKIMAYAIQVTFILLSILTFLFSRLIAKKWKEFLLLIITLIIVFSFAEISLRIGICSSYELAHKYNVMDSCGYQAMYEGHHYLNYELTPNYKSPDGLNMHNSLGFRGPEIKVPKPKGMYRIVTLGGSTTYTIHVKDWHKDFARTLQESLRELYKTDNIEVINAGVNGYDSFESLGNLEYKVLDLDPDMIIIYHGTNDVHARLVNPYHYKGDNSGKRRQWKKESMPFIFNSIIVKMITHISFSGIRHYVESKYTPGAGIVDTGFNDILNGTPMETLEKNPPIYFKRNLKNMVAIAKANNISVLLATWAYTTEKGDYASTPHYIKGFKENNEVVKMVGRETNTKVFDFESVMPKDMIYWADGRHVNVNGSELKGSLFASYIYENDMIHIRNTTNLS